MVEGEEEVGEPDDAEDEDDADDTDDDDEALTCVCSKAVPVALVVVVSLLLTRSVSATGNSPAL